MLWAVDQHDSIDFKNLFNYCRNKLHTGVYRDIAQQEQRKFENMYILEQQRELTKKLRESEQQQNAAKELKIVLD